MKLTTTTRRSQRRQRNGRGKKQRTTEALGRHPRFLPFVVLVVSSWLILPGCGLFGDGVKQDPIPLDPRPPVDLREDISRQAAYAADVLDAVEVLGAEPASEAVAQAADSADLVESYLGPPIERIPVAVETPGTGPDARRLGPCPVHERYLERAREALELWREAQAEHEEDLDDLREEQMERGGGGRPWFISLLLGLGWWLLPLAVLGLLVLLPEQVVGKIVGGVIDAVRAVVGEIVLRATHTLAHVVEGVQRAKGEMEPEQLDVLRQKLTDSTTLADKERIALIKERVKADLSAENAETAESKPQEKEGV